MKTGDIILTVAISTFAGALGFGLYNYLARKKALPPPVPAQPVSTTAPPASITQPLPPVTVSQPIQPSPPPTGAQSLTRNWSMDYSSCICTQGFGGHLTYTECQNALSYCKQFHNATTIYIQ